MTPDELIHEFSGRGISVRADGDDVMLIGQDITQRDIELVSGMKLELLAEIGDRDETIRALKDKYNRTLRRESKAEAYLEGQLSEEQKTRCLKGLFSVLDEIAVLMGDLINAGYCPTRNEVTKGFGQ